MTAGLPQSQQGGQDPHASLAEALGLEQLLDLLATLFEEGLVGVALGAAQLAVDDLLDLLRQIRRDGALGAAQEEWGKPAPQARLFRRADPLAIGSS